MEKIINILEKNNVRYENNRIKEYKYSKLDFEEIFDVFGI